MIEYEEDYDLIESESHGAYSSYLSFGERIFFVFSMEPNSDLDKALGNLVPSTQKFKVLPWCKGKNENESMRNFARELLECGEVIFTMSEKYRKLSNGGIGFT